MKRNAPMPPNEKPGTDRGQPAGKQLTFHYIKSNHFRVIHGDGVHGGLTPKGDAIQMAVFSDRQPIPVQTTHVLEKDGKVGAEMSKVCREGIVREVEAEIILGIADAERIAGWLTEKVKLAKKLSAKRSRK